MKISQLKRLALFTLILTVAAPVTARDIGVIYRNNTAVRKVQKERALDAYSEFVSLLANSPFDPTLQFNVGSSLNVLGELEKAEALYKQLLTQVDELMAKPGTSKETLQELARVRFGILYNLGVYYQGKKEIDLALENYQGALEHNPESREIKTNIEMMFAQGQGEGKGDQDKNDDKEGDKDKKDQKEQQDKDKKDGKPKEEKEKKEPEKGKKEFDQKQMSMEDLKRIMEELKEQEQGIRAKFQGKGGKNGNKEKEW